MTETEIGTIVMLSCTPLRLSASSERSERAREKCLCLAQRRRGAEEDPDKSTNLSGERHSMVFVQ